MEMIEQKIMSDIIRVRELEDEIKRIRARIDTYYIVTEKINGDRKYGRYREI